MYIAVLKERNFEPACQYLLLSYSVTYVTLVLSGPGRNISLMTVLLHLQPVIISAASAPSALRSPPLHLGMNIGGLFEVHGI